MKLSIISLAIVSLSACNVDETTRVADAKSLVDVIEDKCDKNYTYLRYKLAGEDGKTVTMNIRVNKAQLDKCEITEATVCVEGTDKKLDLDNVSRNRYRSEPNIRRVKEKTLITVTSSEPNDKNQEDRLSIDCRDTGAGATISGIHYEAGVPTYERGYGSVWSYDDGQEEFIGEDGNERGKELLHYQDSMCFPESGSQCDASGSGK